MPHKEFKKLNKAVNEFSEGFDRGIAKKTRGLRSFIKGALTGGLTEARGGELPANRKARKDKARFLRSEGGVLKR